MSERWSPEKEQTLRDLVDAGLTASQIAREMGLASKNCAIGKIFRLGAKLKGQWGSESRLPQFETAVRSAWLDGLSIGEIGRRLSIPRATIGAWARRLDLPPRQVNVGGRPPMSVSLSPVAPAQPAVEAVVKFPAVSPKGVHASGKPISGRPMRFLDAEYGRCRFPLWGDAKSTPVEFLFYCGDPSGQSSYCPHHASRCYGIGSRAERNAHKAAA